MNNLEATRKLVLLVCHCKLPEDDLIWMEKCVNAFFNKNDSRRIISKDERRNILELQHYSCAICGRKIDLNEAHMDHVIPWDYVGDQLDGNIQGLCSECNLKKTNHVSIAVANLILHREVKV